MVTRLEVTVGTRLAFQPLNAPVSVVEDFYDLGLVLIAEQHTEGVVESADPYFEPRMVVECEGVEASTLAEQLNWPRGEIVLAGMVRYGSHTYPATLQLRARAGGLKAILYPARG